jgi:hypothetical protein
MGGRGTAESIQAVKMTGGKPVRSRPLCVYPAAAKYEGGSIGVRQPVV